ncbi:MAG: hypothetical protein WCO23_01350 [bacterium]
MSTKNTVVIFGGEDAESTEARLVATAAGLVIGTAIAEGKPVHAGNAYKADAFQVDAGEAEGLSQAIIFECSPAAAGSLAVIIRCDHHNPGDHGYSLGADQYFEASSLGQLMMLLGIEPTIEQRLIAAADHCPALAYQGLCPGIDPAIFQAHRVAGKVAFYASSPRTAAKADPELVEAAIAKAIEILQSASLVDGVRDLRGAGVIDELPEAALRIGEAYMAEIPDTDRDRQPSGNRKIVLGGHTSPEAVTGFMAWANTLPNKIGDAYGNPTRGFAGVVVKPAE